MLTFESLGCFDYIRNVVLRQTVPVSLAIDIPKVVIDWNHIDTLKIRREGDNLQSSNGV